MNETWKSIRPRDRDGRCATLLVANLCVLLLVGPLHWNRPDSRKFRHDFKVTFLWVLNLKNNGFLCVSCIFYGRVPGLWGWAGISAGDPQVTHGF